MANFIFPKPDIPKPDYSSRDLSLTKKTSFAPGCLIPILMKDVLPGDKIRINIVSLIESLPMIAPALDGWKANFDFYFEPWSNLYGFMDNNRREGTEDLINKKRHTFTFGIENNAGEPVSSQTVVDASVKPASFHDFFGLPCGYFGDVTEDSDVRRGEFPAEKWLAYWDIIRTYYVNNQEGYFPMLSEADPDDVGTEPLGGAYFWPLSLLDDMFMMLRQKKDGVVLNNTPFTASDDYPASVVGPINQFINLSLNQCIAPYNGLSLRTYRMDLNRGIMNAEVGNLKSKVQVTDNSFSIDTLRFANKMQKLIDRFDVSGGRFSDWMRAQWSVKVRGNLDVPDYLGTVSEFFGNTDVIATSNGAVSTSTGVSQEAKLVTLGQQAGFAVGRVNRDNSPISFHSDQYGTLVCIFSLVPIVDYSQGIEIENLKTKFADVYSPAMAQLGYQDVDRRELSALPYLTAMSDSTYDVDDWTVDAPAVGKRVAWSEYMASLGRNHGVFAFGEDFDYWVNQRQYTTISDEVSLSDPNYGAMLRYGKFSNTTYVFPGVWNYLFSDASRIAQNFRLRVRFDINAKRPVGSRLMPHL